MTNDEFLTALDGHLAHLAPADRHEILTDVEAFFADGLRADDFGDPKDFAAQFSSTSTDSARPWFIPSFDIFTDPRATDRWWDPSNPAILVPKSFGIGWDVNLAALAVKTGLIRPDDLDDDVLGAASPALTRVIRRAPQAIRFAALPAVVGLVAQRKYTASLGHTTGLALTAVLTRNPSPQGLIGACLATGLNATLLISTLAELADRRGRGRDVAKLTACATAPALALALIKSGLSRVTKEEQA